eukprot:1483960-Prymnesium_polylepis.1
MYLFERAESRATRSLADITGGAGAARGVRLSEHTLYSRRSLLATKRSPREKNPASSPAVDHARSTSLRTKISNSVTSKAVAAKRGCLSARHWQDIRLARSEGITLIMHGVTMTPRGKDNQAQAERNTVTTAHGGRGQPTDAVSKACEH